MENSTTTFADHLEKRYGKIGTPKRDEFEIRSRSFMIGEMIKEERRLANMTQEELAEKAGTKKAYISRIENGKSDIQLTTLYKIIETGLGKRLDLIIGYIFNHMPSPQLTTNRQVQQLANLELLARQVVEGFITGLHQSPFHGFSVEFAEHRLYNNGESVKNIDWKLMARTDRLYVKQFEEETNLRSYLLLDTSSSMNYPEKGMSKMQFSVYAIAALMYLFKKQRDAFGLCFFSDKVDWLSRTRSTSNHLFYLFAELERMYEQPKANNQTDIAGVLHHIAEDVHQRSMIILFSDMLENGMDEQKSEALFSSLQHLKHNKHEIVIFNVTDHQKELAFDFNNQPHHFIDLESGEELRVHPNEIRNSYLTSLNKWRKELQLKCAQYHIDLVDANIHDGFDKVLKAYLIKRNKMM